MMHCYLRTHRGLGVRKYHILTLVQLFITDPVTATLKGEGNKFHQRRSLQVKGGQDHQHLGAFPRLGGFCMQIVPSDFVSFFSISIDFLLLCSEKSVKMWQKQQTGLGHRNTQEANGRNADSACRILDSPKSKLTGFSY